MIHLSLYEWLYITTNVFWVYTIYKFMGVFYDSKRTSPRVELLSYIAFYVIITLLYLNANIPIVLISSNLVTLFCLTFNYESALPKRVLTAFLTFLILLIVELISALLTGCLHFSIFAHNTFASSFGLIVCRIFSFLVVLVLTNFKNIKKGEFVPSSNWICIALIPISSLYLVLLLFQSWELEVQQILAGIIVLLLINFTAFYLYDTITAALSERMQGLLVMEQNKYYEKQFELIKASVQTTSMIRHDLKNHMLAIRSLNESGNDRDLTEYINNIMDSISTGKNYAASGNMVIDSIINFKIQEAAHNGIRTAFDLHIPDVLEIPSFDMTIILGNLLDNAIRAANSVKEGGYIDITMKYDKGRLLIQTENSYDGEIQEKDGILFTTKEDKENHGIGLDSVRRTLLKYNGSMDVEYNGNDFSVTILMYVD